MARMDRGVRTGVWQPREGMQLLGKTLGVVGLGGIGREVARIASGMGMDVVAWNRTAVSSPVPLVRSTIFWAAPTCSRSISRSTTRRAACSTQRALRNSSPAPFYQHRPRRAGG